MTVLKRFLILSLLIITPGILMSQEPLFSSSREGVYWIPWMPRETGPFVFSNAILKEIAKTVLKEPAYVRVEFHYRLNLSVRQHNGRNRLTISLTNRSVTGDVLFRSFLLTNRLVPAKAEVQLRLANRDDTTAFSETTLRDLVISANDTLAAFYLPASYNPQLDTLMIGRIGLFYDEQAFRSFLERMDLINNYYAAGAMIDSLGGTPDQIDLTNRAQLPLNFIRVSEINNVVKQIRKQDFQTRLLDDAIDFKQLTGRSQNLYRRSRSLTVTFMESVANPDPFYWDGNTDKVCDLLADRILSYVRRSQQMDQLYGTIYQSLLDQYYDADPESLPADIYNVMLRHMFAGSRSDTLLKYFAGRTTISFENVAKKLIDDKRFAEAFAMIRNGRKLMEALKISEHLHRFDAIQSQAAEGILDSYVGIASSCIEARKFDMADQYLRKAGAYVAVNKSFIRTDSAYRAVYSHLFFMRNTRCDALLAGKEYQESLNCYDDIEALYPSEDLRLVRTHIEQKRAEARRGLLSALISNMERCVRAKQDDDLLRSYDSAMKLNAALPPQASFEKQLSSFEPIVAAIRYQRYITSGYDAVDKGRFTLSVSKLQEAKKLAATYGIDPDPAFDSVFRWAYRNYLLVKLSAAQRYIWSQNYDSARIMSAEIKASGVAFGLSADPGFSAALRNFERRIGEQQCSVVQDSIDLYLIKADRSLAIRSFINAGNYLQEAMRLAGAAKACGFNIAGIRDTLARYQWAIQYQQTVAGIDATVASGSFDEAIRLLEANERLYTEKRLDRFGFSAEGVYDYVSKRSNPLLTFHAAAYYAHPGYDLLAFRFLQLLRIQGLPDKETTRIQSEVGTMLAQYDLNRRSGSDGAALVDEYTSGDNWYQTFRNSYMKEWNRQKKR